MEYANETCFFAWAQELEIVTKLLQHRAYLFLYISLVLSPLYFLLPGGSIAVEIAMVASRTFCIASSTSR